MRRVLAALALLLLVPAAPAAAAPRIDAMLEDSDVNYGEAHQITGTLRDGTAPLAGQQVVLQGRRYPYLGAVKELQRVVTDAAGRFRFRVKLDRNWRLSVTAPLQDARTPELDAYTFPAFRLSFRAGSNGVLELTQRYRVPKDVRLREPTLFYLGPLRARRSTLRLRAATTRVARGRYIATARARLPAAWHGRFRYGSCFKPTPGSGMGNARATCPKRLRFT